MQDDGTPGLRVESQRAEARGRHPPLPRELLRLEPRALRAARRGRAAAGDAVHHLLRLARRPQPHHQRRAGRALHHAQRRQHRALGRSQPARRRRGRDRVRGCGARGRRTSSSAATPTAARSTPFSTRSGCRHLQFVSRWLGESARITRIIEERYGHLAARGAASPPPRRTCSCSWRTCAHSISSPAASTPGPQDERLGVRDRDSADVFDYDPVLEQFLRLGSSDCDRTALSEPAATGDLTGRSGRRTPAPSFASLCERLYRQPVELQDFTDEPPKPRSQRRQFVAASIGGVVRPLRGRMGWRSVSVSTARKIARRGIRAAGSHFHACRLRMPEHATFGASLRCKTSFCWRTSRSSGSWWPSLARANAPRPGSCAVRVRRRPLDVVPARPGRDRVFAPVRGGIYRVAIVAVVVTNYLALRGALALIRTDSVDGALLEADRFLFGTVPTLWLERSRPSDRGMVRVLLLQLLLDLPPLLRDGAGLRRPAELPSSRSGRRCSVALASWLRGRSRVARSASWPILSRHR